MGAARSGSGQAFPGGLDVKLRGPMLTVVALATLIGLGIVLGLFCSGAMELLEMIIGKH